MKKRKIFIIIVILLIILAIIGISIKKLTQDNEQLKSIKSEKQLMSFYKGKDNDTSIVGLRFFTIPFGVLPEAAYGGRYVRDYTNWGTGMRASSDAVTTADVSSESSVFSKSSNSVEKDYSTTNIQVENVDEADITKTDGNYIYSISENKVVITNVENPSNMKIETKILPDDNFIPEDIILYESKIVIISSKNSSGNQYDTMVSIYDITNKSMPQKVEEYILYSKYYTSRCINGNLIVIASSYLRKEDNKVVTYYEENNERKEIGLKNIKYLKNKQSDYQTIVSSINLNKEKENVKINSYLFNVENAYISEKNVYLLNDGYEHIDKNKPLKYYLLKLAKKGIIGYIKDDEIIDNNYYMNTTIYKFEINEQGNLEYKNNTKVKGYTIDQFSIDEYDENLRVALHDEDGSRVVVLNKNLKVLGTTKYLSKGEKMYSTRFLGNKAYMVTYKNTDPLYVIDLTDPRNPKQLGELKIPGYSTYLHPYDENHIIGIGMQTEEIVNKNASGNVINTRAVITGMKMALFDVSDVNKPIQISETIIGDKRTTSAILTNHKALLFSKEKEILAIPVNKYPSDFEITTNDSSDISEIEKSYTNKSENYTAEGYFVYNINLEDGFKLKGIIEHEKENKSSKNGYSYGSYYNGRLLRGLWIENNLFTISEDMIKVNNLDDLSLISELKVKK